ncbi:MAG TPA: flagellar hook-associated protein FlgK [Devosia sp.]|nr:flagellar hook-associated protein FlgK [Devosia sp.]
MGLGVSLTNALSGMNVSQNSLEVLSRNVSNAGTPGYHKQSLSVIDTKGVNSVYARSGGIERAFNQSLQAHYTSALSDSGFASTQADALDRLQMLLGKPGDAGSLDTTFLNFQSALQQLGTSPDNYATRASVVSQAQALASTLNNLTSDVQGLRRESEIKIAGAVDTLNKSIDSLTKINARLADQSTDMSTRAALMDQRDRLVSDIAGIIDVRVDYRADDTVGLMTRSGVGILDVKPSIFEFDSAGALSADSQFNVDPDKNGVGSLILHTPAGLTLDLVQQNVLKSGSLAALVDLRDNTLVAAQSQLDDIAAGLAQSLSTVRTEGTAASSGPALGLAVDISSIRNGNDLLLEYTQNGVAKTLRLVRVEDSSKLPLDYVDANGTRVVGTSFAGGAAGVAAALGTALGAGFSVSGSGSTVTVLDDGAAGTTDIDGLTARGTATGLQNSLGLNLFVDQNNADFTNALDGKGQLRGFAGRIGVNSAILTDNKLLVQYAPGGSLGDSARADYLLEQLQTMNFASAQPGSSTGQFRLGGSVDDLIAQMMDYQGSVAEASSSNSDTQSLTLETLGQRLDAEYGVNVDEEMARLMELQNAYAANARVISVVQDLLNRLMEL